RGGARAALPHLYLAARRRRRAAAVVLPALRLLRRRLPRGSGIRRSPRRAGRRALDGDRLARAALRRTRGTVRSSPDAGPPRAHLPIGPDLLRRGPARPALLPQPGRGGQPVAADTVARGEDPGAGGGQGVPPAPRRGALSRRRDGGRSGPSPVR